MGLNVKRVQTTLTTEEYRQLSRLSDKLRKPLSTLIREAVEQVYFARKARDHRRAALQNLLALNAPVASWQQIEKEIEQGAVGR